MKKTTLLLFIAVFLFPSISEAQDTEIRKDLRENLDLLNFLNTKMITGYNVESDLSFQFWKGNFPELEVSSPATVKNSWEEIIPLM